MTDYALPGSYGVSYSVSRSLAVLCLLGSIEAIAVHDSNDFDHIAKHGFLDRWLGTSISAPLYAPVFAPELKQALVSPHLSPAPAAKVQIPSDKWQAYVLDPSAPWNRDAIGVTVDRLMRVLTSDGPAAVAFDTLNPAEISPLHLLAALTVTCSWKDQVKGWHAAFEVARVGLNSAGHAADDLLRGLDG